MLPLGEGRLSSRGCRTWEISTQASNNHHHHHHWNTRSSPCIVNIRIISNLFWRQEWCVTAAPARWPELGLHLLRDRRFLWMIIDIVMRMIIVTSTVNDFWMIMRIPRDPLHWGPSFLRFAWARGLGYGDTSFSSQNHANWWILSINKGEL